jgi:hypothetical protein
VLELPDDGLQPLLKVCVIHSAIGIRLHDGMDELVHQILAGSAGGPGQASDDESRGHVGEIDAPRMGEPTVKIKVDDISELLGS